MCRLKKLFRLICRTTRRQNELVNHDLMFKFIHFRRTPCPTRGDWLSGRLSTVFLSFFALVVFCSSASVVHHYSRVEQTQIFTVGAGVEAARRDWQEGAANQRRASPLGIVFCERIVPCRRGLYYLLTLSFTIVFMLAGCMPRESNSI